MLTMSAEAAIPRGWRGICFAPARFSLLALALYAVLLLPMLAARGFDPSVFILAGANVVDTAQARHRIAVIPDSDGYDGQYFYRLAIAPWSTDDRVDGVAFDVPAKRMLRIVYPVLARAFALGQDRFVPVALVVVNLLGLAAIAAIASWLARAQGLPWWFPCAVVSWPGFLVSLTHDTAEIVTAALLLAALACYLRDRLWSFGTLAALAMLARETSVPILLGILIVESAQALASGTFFRQLKRLIPIGFAFLPLALWWLLLSRVWKHPPQSLNGYELIGWPLVGISEVAMIDIANVFGNSALSERHVIQSAINILMISGLFVFAAAVFVRLVGTIGQSLTMNLAVGWLLMVALLSLLSGTQVWIDPHGYLRVFAECWLVGWLLLALLPPEYQRSRVSPLLLLVLLLDANFATWVLCFRVLPVG